MPSFSIFNRLQVLLTLRVVLNDPSGEIPVACILMLSSEETLHAYTQLSLEHAHDSALSVAETVACNWTHHRLIHKPIKYAWAICHTIHLLIHAQWKHISLHYSDDHTLFHWNTFLIITTLLHAALEWSDVHPDAYGYARVAFGWWKMKET